MIILFLKPNKTIFIILEKLPAGYHSTKGIGKTEPDPALTKTIDGTLVRFLYI